MIIYSTLFIIFMATRCYSVMHTAVCRDLFYVHKYITVFQIHRDTLAHTAGNKRTISGTSGPIKLTAKIKTKNFSIYIIA